MLGSRWSSGKASQSPVQHDTELALTFTNQASECPFFTRVDPALFESPVAPVSVSGGTAAFFRLQLKEATSKCSRSYYIGKDLSHAADEVNFYEQASCRHLDTAVRRGGIGASFSRGPPRGLSRSPGLRTSQPEGLPRAPSVQARQVKLGQDAGESLGLLLGFMFEYAGILSCAVEGADAKEKPKDVLVLRNLHDGCRKLRMLDFKIGQKTAAAGWQGKSKSACARQAVIDGVTNSISEGFRLEGFEGAPPSIATMDPLIDLGGGKPKAMKKAFRLMLQRMPGAEVIMHFIDVHQDPADPGAEGLKTLRSPLEVAELVLRETTQRLTKLAAACRCAPVPQKWIGSSVALAFDCGQLPARELPEEEIFKTVKVHIFDWGRSELNTTENHIREQQDRGHFWALYGGGIDRLAWEAARAYWHRFSNSAGWREAYLTVLDFDSHSENDFIGRVRLFPVQETAETTTVLTSASGAAVRGSRSGTVATLTYSVDYRKYPEGSRLHGAWRFCVVRAENLPLCNWTVGTTDAFVELVAFSSEDCPKSFRQVTSIKQNSLNPEWNETLELPLAEEPGQLEELLYTVSTGLGAAPLDSMLPCEEAILNQFGSQATLQGPDDAHGFAIWLERLNQAMVSPALSLAPSSPSSARRLAPGQSVSLIEQGSLPTRLLACLGGVLSCSISLAILLYPMEIYNDPGTWAIAVCQLLLVPSALVFELSASVMARSRCLDLALNVLIQCCGCLTKTSGRGFCYHLQGALWIFDWVHTYHKRPWHLTLVMGLYQCLVGALLLAIHLGVMSVRLVRKAHWAHH